MYCKCIHVTRPAKITDFLSLLYHNLITIYTTATESSLLLQNLMGFLLQLTEMGYYILNGRYKQKYNLHSHSRFLQAQSHTCMSAMIIVVILQQDSV